jgi:hypothetical protein
MIRFWLRSGTWEFNGYLNARNHIRNHHMAGQH